LLLTLVLSCSSAPSAPEPVDPCAECFRGCDDPACDVAAYRCVWYCEEVCAAVRDQ